MKIHPKVFEYLIKSYYYTGSYSYEYFLETLTILPLSKKFNLEEEKEKAKESARREMEGITEENLEEFSSVAWSTREKQGTLYNTLFEYLKRLNNEDIYRLLLVLFPDSQFKKMAWDRWNCRGEDVKDWHNNLIHYLEVCGIKYDTEKKQLISSDEELNIKNIIARSDLIDIKFEDIFYRNLTKEINKCYKLGSYTASFILSRKLIENLVIGVLRKKFPPSPENLEIYYRAKEGRFHDLTILLKNLEEKKFEFGIDAEIITEFFKLIKPFRPTANSNAHSILIWGDKDELDKLQVEKMAGLLIKILRNIK
jgi:hypothetical protein